LVLVAAKGVDTFTNAIKDGSAAAVAPAAAQGKLDIAQRQQKNTIRLSKVAEKLRQIRDDESLSIAQRTQANKDLGIVLKQQLNAELAIARQALLVANLRIKAEGKSKEALEKQAQALTGISDIQERIVGQEQSNYINSLRKKVQIKQRNC
jgi:tRNA uridine 5-carbamoylmethylation protein Kti12